MRRQGFTLIELLVTLAVLVILATVAVPGFQRMMAVNRVAADYNEVLSGLNFARSEAIKRRAPVQFEASNNGTWQYVVSIVSGEELRVRSGRDGRTSLSAGTIEFNALGRRESCTSPNDCSFTLSSTFSGIQDRGAQVSIMGRVGRANEAASEEVQ
ncbi:MAG: GspH/FimT family pseudopilin [Pseudomonadota bacterium]